MSSFASKFFGKDKSAALPMPQIEMDNEQRYRPITLSMVRRLLRTLAPFKKAYIAGVCMGLTQVLLEQQGPRFMRSIINATIPRQVFFTIGLWAAVFICSVSLERWKILIMTRAGESVQFLFRRKLFS